LSGPWRGVKEMFVIVLYLEKVAGQQEFSPYPSNPAKPGLTILYEEESGYQVDFNVFVAERFCC
jgi:hypothetical protein